MTSEKMDVSSSATNEADQESGKVEQHTQVLFRGFRLILEQYSTLQDVSSAVLPDDIHTLLQKVMDKDGDHRKAQNGVVSKSEGRVKGHWDYARTAAMIERALANGVEGIVKKPGGVVVQEGVSLKGLAEKAPHMVMADSYMRSQAVDFDENLTINGPFDVQKVEKPVSNACKMEWFQLPKTVKLDYGKAEGWPGMKIELGDPVKCGCNRETTRAYNSRPMFYKVLELLTVDFDRLGSFFSILVEDARAEVKKLDDAGKKALEPIVDDLDDVCLMQCNRAAALLYLMCQNSREVALQSSGLTGFTKNWLRLAHGSKVLFEYGKTDLQNQWIKQGKAKYPPKRVAPGGGGSGPSKFSRGRGGGGRGGARGGGSFASDRYGGYDY